LRGDLPCNSWLSFLYRPTSHRRFSLKLTKLFYVPHVLRPLPISPADPLAILPDLELAITGRYSLLPLPAADKTKSTLLKNSQRAGEEIASIFGAERDVEGPMSVVGASRVGGELVEANLWAAFFMMLASLKYFLALFNLIPLPPFDGGHIAVVIYEKIRDFFRKIQSKAPAGPADYTKLMPVTYVIAAALMSVAAVIIVADFVNPI